jgi:hypothetical protein
VTEHPVHPRADHGNSAAYFSFPELKTLEAHVSEIPPGEVTGLHRHSCEALFYVLAGKVIRRSVKMATRRGESIDRLVTCFSHQFMRGIGTSMQIHCDPPAISRLLQFHL